MKEKGFTLIELISTIVILGIVFTIVSVLVLGIVRSAKENAKKRNIDLYGKMVETAMAEYQSQNLKYPDKIEDLTIEYTGPKVECDIQRINPDHTIYLSDCKVNNKLVSNYHYGTLVLTDEEYVDTLGKNIEAALKNYHNQHNKYPVNYRLLDLPDLDKDVNCVSRINYNGTVYLHDCTIDGKKLNYIYGKIEYPIATDYLLEKTNPKSIANYTDGNIHEMYTFEHNATEQTPALTDYRYIGSNPYNYVEFNNGETWRIIGVFETDDGTGIYSKRLKILRNESIGKNQWNSNNINEWVNSKMQVYLNDTYIIDSNDMKLIENTKFYLGGLGVYPKGKNFYILERGLTVAADDRNTYWVGKVALMYPSDYVYTYAYGVDTVCYDQPSSCKESAGGYPASGWMYFSHSGFEWFISSTTKNSGESMCIYSQGHVYSYNTSTPSLTRPVLYLKSNVKIISGNGTIDNPYKLSL